MSASSHDRDLVAQLATKWGVAPSTLGCAYDQEGYLSYLSVHGLPRRPVKPSGTLSFWPVGAQKPSPPLHVPDPPPPEEEPAFIWPEELWQLTHLIKLDFRNSDFSTLPPDIGRLSRLRDISVWFCARSTPGFPTLYPLPP